MILQFGATSKEGFWFEIFVVIAVATMTVMALKKYYQKGKNKPALLLFMVFLNWTIGVVISWLAKLFSAYLGLDNIDITDFGSYLTRLVLDFRLLFLFVAIALFCSYVLRVKLFEKEYKHGELAVNIIFLITIPILCFVLVEKGNMLYTVIVFLVVFVNMLVVYTGFIKQALAQYKSADAKFKGAFKALTLQAWFFILTFLNFLLDQVVLALTTVGFTIFYFAAWICAVVGIVLTYYGYIKPRA
jgi:hypothetical protein